LPSAALESISDSGAIEAAVKQVLAGQPSREDYRAGREKAFNALVGQ